MPMFFAISSNSCWPGSSDAWHVYTVQNNVLLCTGRFHGQQGVPSVNDPVDMSVVPNANILMQQGN
jgi:hypothetical protein